MPKYVKTTLTVTAYTEVTDAPYWTNYEPHENLMDFMLGATHNLAEFINTADVVNCIAHSEYVTELPHRHEEESE